MAKEWDWEKEVEQILKEASFNSRLKAFSELLDREKISVPEDWQEVFNALFESLLSKYPAFGCCILAFTAGQVWQKYYARE